MEEQISRSIAGDEMDIITKNSLQKIDVFTKAEENLQDYHKCEKEKRCLCSSVSAYSQIEG